MPEAAIPALAERAGDLKLSDSARKLAVDSLAFIHAKESAQALISLAAEGSPVRDYAIWWLDNRKDGEWASMKLESVLKEKDLLYKVLEIQQITVPKKPKEMKFTIEQVLALKGDAGKGKTSALRCIMCHQIDGQGAEYGPTLKGFGLNQAPEVLARAIINPSFDFSHGFDGHALLLDDGKWIDGLILFDGKSVKIRSTGDITQDIPKSRIKSHTPMNRSLILSADQLGLSAQDVADIVEWMKSY